MGFSDSIMLNGSVVLRRIFEAQTDIVCNNAGLLLSPVSLCSPTCGYQSTKGISSRVRTDIEKTFEERIISSNCKYIAVDFYSAAAISLYKLGDSYFTATEAFRHSDFYQAHQNEMSLISPPFAKELWQDAFESYAKLLKKHYGENIILIRLSFSERCVRQTELRTTPSKAALTRRIREMEEFFIRLADPIVIDVSGQYFGDLDNSSPSAYEEYFYMHVRKLLAEILRGSKCRLFNMPDPDIFLCRVIRYYDSMSARAFWGWLTDGTSAADLLVRYTSKSFITENRELFLRLKHESCSLADVKRLFSTEPYSRDFIAAAEAVSSLLAGDISQPYNRYSVIFRRRLNAASLMAKLLSERLGRKISEHDCEAAFLMKDEPRKLTAYLSASPAVTVDIWGSCVCRESVNRSPELITVDKYIFKQPCLLAFEDPVPCEIPPHAESFGGSAWRRRTVSDALGRNGMDILRGSSAKWVLVDLYDLISKMSLLDGAHLFECDSFLRRTAFYSSIEDRCTLTYLFNEKSTKFCDAAMKRFAEFLTERYGSNIILVKAHPNDSFIGLDGRLHPLADNDGTLARKRDFISIYEDMLTQLTDCYVIDISVRFCSDDSFRMGGSHIVHYEEEFYRTCCSHIIKILGGTEQKLFTQCDERYLALRDMRLDLP